MIMSRMDKYIQWDQRDRGSSIPSEKREKILWESVSACAEIVLHSLYFSQTNREVEKEVEKGEKEVVEEVEKKFELSLAVFLDSMEKIRSLLIEGKESKVEKEGKEAVFIPFDRYLSLPPFPSSTTVVEKEGEKEVEKGGSKLILSPEWLKLVSLTVRTVLSWCTLLLQAECENSASLPLSTSVPTLPPSSSVTTTTTPAPAATTTPTIVNDGKGVVEEAHGHVSASVTVSVSVPVCVRDGMGRARQLLIQLIGKYASCAPTCTYMRACYK
jgi:hypothetical protein